MQGEVSTKDLISGSIILAVFLVCVYFAGRVLSRFKNSRFERAWEPLRPVIGGHVVSDGGGAATSWLTGTYKGRPVCASMIPDRNRYPNESGFYYNYFDVALLETPGKSDWSLNKQAVSKDKALEQRLRDAGAMTMLATIGTAEASYNAREQKLTIVQEPGASWVPPREHFEKQLAVLLRLGEVNVAVNY